MTDVLIKGGVIVTLDPQNRVLRDYGLAIRDGRIATIAPRSYFSGQTFETVIDASGHTVVPGLINAHMHCYSSFATGLGKAEPAGNFNQVLQNLWWRLDKQLTREDCYYSALIACIQSIKHGTTTMIDHHASPNAIDGSLDAVARAMTESGIRGSLCYEVSDRDGETAARAGIAENVRFIERLAADGRHDDRLHALFGLHAAFTLGDETLRAVAEAGHRLGTGFHIHVAEAASDQQHSLAHYGQRVVERLHRFEISGPNTIYAHCVHVNDAERALIAKSGTIVTHQPQSNMNNGVGVCDITAMNKRGITLGLGTDAMTNNMLEELRSALWVQRLERRDPSAGFLEVLHMLVDQNAVIANRFFGGGLGALVEGHRADIAIFDYDPHTELAKDSVGGHLIFGLSQARVDTTIVAGKPLMRAGELLHLDEHAVMAAARQHARELWRRF